MLKHERWNKFFELPQGASGRPWRFSVKTEQNLGRTPSTAGTFRKKFRKNSGKTPETLSEHFLEFPSRVRLGCPKPYNSRHSRLPEHFQNSPPPSAAGGASFFRSGSERASQRVMEFPAVLGVFLKIQPEYLPGKVFLTPWLKLAGRRKETGEPLRDSQKREQISGSRIQTGL